MHALAGLKKGDTISITRESLPGALLFPGIKYKERKAEVEVDKEVTSVSAVESADDDPKQAVQEVDSGKIKTAIVKDEANTAHTDGDVPSAPSVKVAEVSEQKANISSSGDPSSIPSQSLIQVHRFLVVTRERFMVLDSGGSGIGSTAVVKSNHHLTEVCHAI